MDDRLVEIIMDQIARVEAKVEEEARYTRAKLEELISFRMMLLGAAAGISGAISVLVFVIGEFIKR